MGVGWPFPFVVGGFLGFVVCFVLFEIGVLCVVLATLDLGCLKLREIPSTASTFQVLGIKASVTIALVSLRCSVSTLMASVSKDKTR